MDDWRSLNFIQIQLLSALGPLVWLLPAASTVVALLGRHRSSKALPALAALLLLPFAVVMTAYGWTAKVLAAVAAVSILGLLMVSVRGQKIPSKLPGMLFVMMIALSIYVGLIQLREPRVSESSSGTISATADPAPTE